MSQITIITNFPQFMIKNSNLKDIELLNDFKLYLNTIIAEFSNNYLYSYDDLINKSTIFIEQCQSLMKVNFYLSLLSIKDKNQTNKYEYEKCLSIATFTSINYISNVTQKMYDFINIDLEIDNDRIRTISKIHGGNSESAFINSLIRNYENNIREQTVSNHNKIISHFNMIINFLLLEIISINEIIKEVNITSNNW